MQDMIFGIVGGLGLFIFGMKYLSEGLQNIASDKIRQIMTKLTNNPIKGITLGTIVTSIVQSSSVTTVILIGLINAGIVNFVQGASVVLGANIGTTITAQIIAFKISQYAFPAIGLGMLLMFITKREKVNFWGQVIFSLGIIFLGLETMAAVVKPLRDIESVKHFFLLFSNHPILAIVSGILITVVIQSSSASIGMLLAFATAGLIDFQSSLYILLGTNIGTTITAWLASIGGAITAKRIATFHTLFNVVGTIYFAVLIHMGIYGRFIDFVTPEIITPETIARHIANAHTFFNVFNTLVFLPLIPFFIKIIEKMLPEDETSIYLSDNIKFLQESLLETPELALESARKEIVEMSKASAKVIKIALDGFFKRDEFSINEVSIYENDIDKLQHDITLYLSKISNERLSTEMSEQLPVFIHTINDIERISDHAVNISEITQKIIKQDIQFTDMAIQELTNVYEILNQMEENVRGAIETLDKQHVENILNLEDELNVLYERFLDQQSDRIIGGISSPRAALIFIELMNNIERIGDHLTNIAKAVSRDFAYTKKPFIRNNKLVTEMNNN